MSFGPVTNHCVTLGKCCPHLDLISEVSEFELQDLPFEIMRLGNLLIHLRLQRRTGSHLLQKAREGLAQG